MTNFLTPEGEVFKTAGRKVIVILAMALI